MNITMLNIVWNYLDLDWSFISAYASSNLVIKQNVDSELGLGVHPYENQIQVGFLLWSHH